MRLGTKRKVILLLGKKVEGMVNEKWGDISCVG